MTKALAFPPPILSMAMALVAIILTSLPVNRAFSPPIIANISPSPSILRRIFDKGRSRGGGATARGDNYGASNNSTILAPSEAAIRVGVKPTAEATKETWQRAWRTHRFMMKVMHRFDGCQPTDSKLALACLWWKALAGNDPTSPVYDYELSYDLLPPITRWLVHRRLCYLYPRLHHANVEIRTAYLDKSLRNVIDTIIHEDITNNTTLMQKKKIKLIVMGGGYDTRSMKLMEKSLLNNKDAPRHSLLRRKQRLPRRPWKWRRTLKQQQISSKNAFDDISSHHYDLECYEFDLHEVVRAKRQLLQSRLFRRRPWLRELGDFPRFVEADFNNLNETRRALEGVLLASDDSDSNDSHETGRGGASVIILFEGVMIYLDEGVPHSLLRVCSDALRKCNQSSGVSSSGYLCFADRLENIPGGDEDAARAEMDGTGWELTDWLPKPGLARHMGIARLGSG